MVKVSELVGEVISYMPVIRVVSDIITTCLSLVRSAVSDIEEKTKQIEDIHRWLKTNDVNNFSQFYEQYIETGKYKITKK